MSEEKEINIEDIKDQRAIEMHFDTIMKYKPIFSNNRYSIYENGLVGKKLIGLRTADVVCDLVAQLTQSQHDLKVAGEALKKALCLVNAAVDSDKTSTMSESLDALYNAIDTIKQALAEIGGEG